MKVETGPISAYREPSAAGRFRRSASPLVAFFALAYALSWAWVVPLAVTGRVVHRGDGWPTHYPSLLGPAIAALAVVAWSAGRPGVRDLLGRLVRWRVPLRWWLVAVSPVGFLGLGLLAMGVAGEPLPAAADFGKFSGTPTIGLLGVVLLVTFVGALGEEVGWRGYALPELQRRHTPLVATMVLALLWFAWHLPQFFLINTYREFAPPEYLGMLLGLSCGAVVLTWLYNRSGGSILVVTVWHGLYNVVGATQAATGTLAALISTLIMIQGVALVALDVRSRKRGRPPVLGPGPSAPRPLMLWVTNHLVNPILRPVLHSRAGRRLGRHLALLRYTGRRSGLRYELPVQYVRDNTRVWILPASPEHKMWWRNLRDRPEVDLTLSGSDVHGAAVVVDESRPSELAEGLKTYLRAVPQARGALGLPKTSEAPFSEEELTRVHAGTVLVRVDLTRDPTSSPA